MDRSTTSVNGSSSARQKLAKLWVKYHSTVACFVRAMVSDFFEAEEILQETAAEIIEKAEEFDETRPFLPWCLGFARNVALKYRRRRARDRHLFNHDSLENLSRAFQELAEYQDHLAQSLEICRAKLSRRSRDVCRLRYEQGLSVQNIASQLRTTPPTVANALYRIREQLRACIERQIRLWEAL